MGESTTTNTGRIDLSAFANAHIESFLMSGHLAIDPEYALSQFSLYMRDLQLLAMGMPYEKLGISERRAKTAPALMSFDEQAGTLTISKEGTIRTGELSGDQVAVIRVRGAMMLEGGASSYGISDTIDWISEVYNNKKIKGIILELESGGGEARAGDLLATTIEERNKPVIAYVNRMAGSAAYNAAAAADEIILSSAAASVGSIGVFMSIDKKMIDKYKTEMLDIYSDATPGKNRDFRALLQGDISHLKNRVNQMTEQFHNYVMQKRPLTGDRLQIRETLEGDMFPGTEATRRGLADDIGNMNLVAKRMKFHIKNSK